METWSYLTYTACCEIVFISGEAKEQISHLTDEISLKAEDNIAQQVRMQLHSCKVRKRNVVLNYLHKNKMPITKLVSVSSTNEK